MGASEAAGGDGGTRADVPQRKIAYIAMTDRTTAARFTARLERLGTLILPLGWARGQPRVSVSDVLPTCDHRQCG